MRAPMYVCACECAYVCVCLTRRGSPAGRTCSEGARLLPKQVGPEGVAAEERQARVRVLAAASQRGAGPSLWAPPCLRPRLRHAVGAGSTRSSRGLCTRDTQLVHVKHAPPSRARAKFLVGIDSCYWFLSWQVNHSQGDRSLGRDGPPSTPRSANVMSSRKPALDP